VPRTDLVWALNEFKSSPRLTRYQVARNYYRGDHDLNFAIEKFRNVFARKLAAIADNLCPAVVDSVADRLKLTGFTSEQAPAAADQAWDVWRRNRLPIRATDTHREALVTGDGYVIVWRDNAGRPAVWPQHANEMAIRYSEETPGEIEVAAKLWRRRDGRWQANLYYPDSIEKYETATVKRTLNTTGVTLKDFPLNLEAAPRVEDAPEDFTGFEYTRNPYGRAPVFHFPNKALYEYGVSELLDVIPLQDGLNKAVCDMFIAMEFAAFQQRWVAGAELEIDEETGRPKPPKWALGIDKAVASTDPETKFGAFPAADLAQFVEVQENLRSEIARVSGTPLHYLFITRGDFPSGEAMKSAEARFSEKLDDKQTGFGDGWEDALTFALRIDGTELPEGFQLEAEWKSATPELLRPTQSPDAQPAGVAAEVAAAPINTADGR
jgi:hypothetical protein